MKEATVRVRMQTASGIEVTATGTSKRMGGAMMNAVWKLCKGNVRTGDRFEVTYHEEGSG